MTPAARVQGAIELLDAIIDAARRGGASADRIAHEWFKSRRFAGSGDRRAIRDLVWRAIRASGEVPPSGRAALLLLAKDDEALVPLFDGSTHGPAPVDPDEPVARSGLAPAWLVKQMRASDLDWDEIGALLERAPLDLRANRLKTTREALAESLETPSEPTAARDGLRLLTAANVDRWPQFEQGLFEVQDTGSQLACEALGASPGESVIDLCAGAGGKTLALAAAMDNRGTLLACDTDRTRLQRIPPRAERAGAAIETRLLNPGREAAMLADWAERADAVLIDAPCSGTGTWRRNPETRWRLTPRILESTAVVQAALLDIAAGLVRPGGRICYVVCSLLDREGADQAAAFLARNPQWRAADVVMPLGTPRGTGRRLTPLHDGTDGFFVACLERL